MAFSASTCQRSGSLSHRLLRWGSSRFSVCAVLGIVVACGAAEDQVSRGQPCPAGKIDCDMCVETSSNLMHCGACDSPCATGQDCVSGRCACVAGLSACGSAC